MEVIIIKESKVNILIKQKIEKTFLSQSFIPEQISGTFV